MSSSWYKIWVVGNGGIPWNAEYVYLPDGMEGEDYAMEVERRFGPLPSSVRSCNWEKVDVLPPEAIEEHILNYEREKLYIDTKIENLKKMRSKLEKTVK